MGNNQSPILAIKGRGFMPTSRLGKVEHVFERNRGNSYDTGKNGWRAAAEVRARLFLGI